MKKMLIAVALVLAIPACQKSNGKNAPMKSEPKKSHKMHKEHATKAMHEKKAHMTKNNKNMQPMMKKTNAKQ